jgi:hypothetical protein
MVSLIRFSAFFGLILVLSLVALATGHESPADSGPVYVGLIEDDL